MYKYEQYEEIFRGYFKHMNVSAKECIAIWQNEQYEKYSAGILKIWMSLHKNA